MNEDLRQVEATGETVGEAKWAALRELEKLHPGLEKSAVRFQVVSEGERGLLGVGYAPARVIASVDSESVAVASASNEAESELAAAPIATPIARAYTTNISDSVSPTVATASAPSRPTKKMSATANTDSISISSTIGTDSRITARPIGASV